MRSIAILMTMMLAIASVPLVLGQPGQPGAPADDDADPTVEELLARIAELEAKVAALAGGDDGGGETQQPCPPGGGCLDTPQWVDETGDDMTGDLNLIENARIKFLPEASQDSFDGAPLAATVLGPQFFDINANTNFTQLVKLHQNATLNTTGGAQVFIDHDGNLTFADGSFLNPSQGFANQNWTFTNDVSILRNLTIHEGGNIIFQNNTGFLQAGNFSRIGTTTHNPFIIMANNETAIIIWPGPTQDDAASIVNGHPSNNVTADTIGNFIAGGGSQAAPNLINGSWGIILGGSGNTILGDHSTAGGKDTATMHSNSFAWGDGSGPFQTTAANTFIVNATGGVGINTDNPVSPLTVGGNITPSEDGVFSLGTPTNRWHQLYMASEIDFVTELLYTSGGATMMMLDDTGNLTIPNIMDAAGFRGDASGLTGITTAALDDGSITTDKLGDSQVTTTKLASGAVTSQRIANGAVTADKLGEVCPVGNVLKSDGSGWGCAADEDTGTTYSAGTGLQLNGTVFLIDPTQVQNRVSAVCAEGSSIRVINQDGSVTCELDDDANSDTLAALTCTAFQVAKYDDLSEAWVCGNDDDTTYGAGFGLNLAGTTFNVSTNDIQRRVASECAAGSSIRAIAQDGTVTCETDTDTDTTYTAAGPISLTGTTFGLTDCALGQVYKFLDGLWLCSEDNTVSSLPWSSITSKPAGFADDVDNDTLYSAGSGLSLAGTQFATDPTSVQNRVTGTCAVDEAIRVIHQDGTVTCQAASTDAETLDGLDSAAFLRSDTSDSFTGGILTLADGTDLKVLGTLASDLIPKTNDTYMLGNQTHRFSDLWLASTIHYASPLTFEMGGQTRFTVDTDGDIVSTGTIIGDALSVSGEATATFVTSTNDMTVGNELYVDGQNIYMGFDQTEATRGIYFREDGNNLGEQIAWSDVIDMFTISDDTRITEGSFGVGVAPTDVSKVNAVQASTVAGGHAVRGEGVFGPTTGYLGVQGATDFDGVLSLDKSGQEIGVLGLSVGGSAPDNVGVLGHSNGAGVRGEASGNPTGVFGQLGNADGYGVKAQGTAGAAQFTGDVVMSPGSDIVLDGNTLGEVGNVLQYNGNDVCLETDNCVDADTLGDLNCSTDQIVRWNGAAWVCAQDTSPARPGAGRLVEVFDADQYVPTLAPGVSQFLCYIDSSGNGGFDVNEPLYLHFGNVCGNSTAASYDLRLTPNAGFAAFTKVRAGHSDFGAALSSYGSLIAYYDADGTGTTGVGDTFYADRDGSESVSVGDYRWTANGQFAAGTVVKNGDTDVSLPVSGLGGVNGLIDFWDVDGTISRTAGDVYYLHTGNGGVVSPNGSVRLGDLATV